MCSQSWIHALCRVVASTSPAYAKILDEELEIETNVEAIELDRYLLQAPPAPPPRLPPLPMVMLPSFCYAYPFEQVLCTSVCA
ncbi:hypothetical protein WN944_027335 [Citrus x changshan-huyou]|uniref:Uncharacterized protein n=1 Tax=Citrus x changshan-huyou TaxID=2935761 RepID=A0AAP0LLR0_9ROSI